MRNIRPPEPPSQNLPFDGFEATHWTHTQLSPAARLRLEEGWQGVFRRTALGALPAESVARHFSPDTGRPTKEIHSMVGLLLIMEFKQWTAEEAAEAYALDAGVQFALNLPRDRQYLSPRCVEYYRRLLREGDEQCAEIFGVVTAKLVQELQLDITKQRLDSTHIFSHMAKMGRCQLMAVTVRRFLAQVLRHNRPAHQALPADLTGRYAPVESRIFGYGRPSDKEYAKRIQQVAEDMHLLVERFADTPAITSWTSYKALSRVFGDQCEVSTTPPAGGRARVEVRKKAVDGDGKSGGVMQNPSDPGAGYSGHKGEGYQAQIAQSYGGENDVNLVTGCLPQSAAESDAKSLIPFLEGQADYGLTPEQALADTAYGSDDNVEKCREAGIKLISPTAGKAKAAEPTPPDTRAEKKAEKKAAEKDGPQAEPATQAGGTGDEAKVPADKAARLEQRRQEEKTDEWKKEYAKRSGVEGVHRAIDRVTGFKDLVVRGVKAVSMAIYLKVTGWNILQAGRSYARKGRLARKAARQAAQKARQGLVAA